MGASAVAVSFVSLTTSLHDLVSLSLGTQTVTLRFVFLPSGHVRCTWNPRGRVTGSQSARGLCAAVYALPRPSRTFRDALYVRTEETSADASQEVFVGVCGDGILVVSQE